MRYPKSLVLNQRAYPNISAEPEHIPSKAERET